MQTECEKGNHVPVVAHDKNFRVLDIFCQNCAVSMTKAEWVAYFPNNKRIDWSEPGDPTNIDLLLDSDPPEV